MRSQKRHTNWEVEICHNFDQIFQLFEVNILKNDIDNEVFFCYKKITQNWASLGLTDFFNSAQPFFFSEWKNIVNLKVSTFIFEISFSLFFFVFRNRTSGISKRKSVYRRWNIFIIVLWFTSEIKFHNQVNMTAFKCI